MSTELGTCEAQWVVAGEERVCGEPATQIVWFEGRQLKACDRCSADLSDFELYRIEREFRGPLAEVESWTGVPE